MSPTLKSMSDSCASVYNSSVWTRNGKCVKIQTIQLTISLTSLGPYCPAFFDRISCWPPTEMGVRRMIPCAPHVFPNANFNGIKFP